MPAAAPGKMAMMKAYINRTSVIGAFIIAIVADLIEMGFGLVFAEGFASPLNDVMDVIVGIVLTVMVGWHIAFLPSFLIKVIPVMDLAPTWTIAVLIATRGRWKATNDPPPPPIIKEPGARTIDVEAEEVPPPVIPPGK
jgi:hypothetical protein